MDNISVINNLYKNLIKEQPYYIGIQTTQRIKYYNIINKFSSIIMNNISDPFFPPKVDILPNTYSLERECIKTYGKWIGISPKNVWGICTNSGSESCFYGIVYANKYFNNKSPYVIFAKESHYTLERYCNLLKLNLILCDVNEYDEIDTNSFKNIIISNKDLFIKNGLIIILTEGTTMKGGYDNLSEINKIMDTEYNNDYYLHLDACLGGLILPFLDNNPINYKKNKFNSISVSCHKMLGTPYPTGMFITTLDNKLHNTSNYTSIDDGTLFCARNGQSILYLYMYLCQKSSFNERKKDVLYCINLRDYFIKKLKENNIHFFCNLQSNASNCIYFYKKTINKKLIDKFHLVNNNIYFHIYIMPHVKKNILDEFIKDYKKIL
jgi:histidine decarboxylase